MSGLARAMNRPSDSSAYPGVSMTVAPVEPVVSLARAKKQIEEVADETFHDDHLEQLVAAATEFAQGQTGLQFVSAEFEFNYDHFPCERDVLFLPKNPCAVLASIEYTKTDATTVVLPTLDYVAALDRKPCRISLATHAHWPATICQAQAVLIKATCGYGAAADVPEKIKSLVLMLVDDWFNHRSGEGETMPAAKAMMTSLRVTDFTQYLPHSGNHNRLTGGY